MQNTERKKTEKSEINNINTNNNYASNNVSNQSIYNSNPVINTNEDFVVFNILEKLKTNLKTFGRKSLLSLIKNFKCYDNGTKFVNKYDFIKVIRDFRLNLTASEIEKLFEFYVTEKRKMLINYEEFINLICLPLSDSRKNLLLEIFEEILFLGKDEQNLELEILKTVYNPLNNIFGNDPDQIYTEFIECIELYHFNYKKKRNNLFSLEEFFEFYRYIGFVVENDQQFEKLIKAEYSKLKEIKEKYICDNLLKEKKIIEEAEAEEEEQRQNEVFRKLQTEKDLENTRNEYAQSRSSFYKENEARDSAFRENNNLENFSNGNKINKNKFNNNNSNKNENENVLNEGVSGDILREKLEILKNNNDAAL